MKKLTFALLFLCLPVLIVYIILNDDVRDITQAILNTNLSSQGEKMFGPRVQALQKALV